MKCKISEHKSLCLKSSPNKHETSEIIIRRLMSSSVLKSLL
nr:MAG TPA: hypothetical protein [Caudoviricetes sp.]